MKKDRIEKRSKAKLILAMSATVFILVSATSFFFFGVFELISELPFLNAEKLPRLSGVYVLVVISLIIGILLSVLFNKYVLIPLHSIYIAIEKIADGDFNVEVKEKGIKSVRRVAASVNITAKELSSMENMRNDFINSFSHEFKTPIVSISGFAKILRKSSVSQQEKDEYLDIIINESDRLSALSANVLNLTRLSNQTIITGISRFNVTEQIRQSVILLEQKWSEKNMGINIDGDEHYIDANRELLSQLWINLIDNAIKFSPVGTEVSVAIEEKGDKLVFTIADSGAGMNEQDVLHAFDRFYQGNEARRKEGYGIGLAITKRICELHDGSIRIKKTGPDGTVFEITLPTER